MKSQKTKEALAEALRRLLKDRPIESVSVTQIVDEAGLSRKTFYYHFSDKYELFNWLCYQMFLDIRDEVFEGDLWDSLLSIARVMESEPFFKDAIRGMGQNSFGQYASDLLYELFHDTLSAGFRSTIKNEYGIEILIGGFVETCRMSIVLWLNSPDPPSAERFVDFLKRGAEAFSMMICFDRALRTDSPVCDLCIENLAETWSLNPDPSTMESVPPEREGEMRRDVEAALRVYRQGNEFIERGC